MIITKHWLRFWRNGPGIAWQHADAPLSFSQRNGYTRTVRVGPIRFWWLK